MYLLRLFLFLNILTLVSCYENKKDHALVASSQKDSASFHSSIKYAKGFNIEYQDGYKVINVSDPWSKSDKKFQYVLFSNGARPVGFAGAQFIEVPVKNFIALSSLYVGYSEKLKVNEKL